MAGERTEAPSQKRLRDARQKGNVSKSQEVVSIGVLLVAVVAFRSLGPGMAANLRSLMREDLGHAIRADLTATSSMELFRATGAHVILGLLPLLGLMAFAAIALSVAQTGLLLSGAHLTPKLSNINPGAGFKRIISKDGLVNLVKAIAKMSVISVVVWMTMSARLAEIVSLGQLQPALASARLAALGFDVALRAGIVLFLLAVADYAWQRRKWIKSLMMSKEEVRQESRETDGDPQIKAAIRRRRQQLMNRMIAAVPKADVVVTNPTHYAVAIKYDPLTMQAPIVVAKGERLLAQRIKDVARKAGVPVLEEPPLARALFASVPIGNPVPANLFRAVAEVLAWVYAIRQRMPVHRQRPVPVGGPL
jgi:flagellar biosynthetic protein FlhB